MSESDHNTPEIRYAPLYRRLLAILYDSFLLIAILFIAVALAMLLNGAETIDQDHPYHTLYVAYLAGTCILYFTWFWTHGGQTLGMKTWRVRLVHADGMNWLRASIHFFASILSWGTFGIGYLIALFHPQNRTLHDIVSGSYLRDLR